MDLFEAIYTTRAMRRVKPDPVPENVVASILDAAIRGPSGGNSQNWRFIAVTDGEVKNSLGPLYREAFARLHETVYKGRLEAAQAEADDSAVRIIKSSAWLAENFERVALWLLVVSRNDPTGASTFPAVWNAMLAARGHGVGTCLTTILGLFRQEEAFEVLGVPKGKGWNLDAAVSCGYPLGRWGVAARAPAHVVSYANRWGTPLPFTVDQQWPGL